jgi:hypothetical protein
MDGIERVRRAIAKDGGYAWCEEHKTYRYWSPVSCRHLHKELPRGHWICEEHACIHTPADQAWYC